MAAAMEKKKYPIRAEDYELFEMVGQGVSAAVRRARCLPLDEIVAIKILDFERHNSDLSNISREAQTMILIDHPNVLNAHCSFVNGHDLWVVMPYMAGGSCLHIMKSVYPNGLEEAVIATVLREVLKGLEYLHRHGHIHRDVKAGNILVDTRGSIKLGDFGVSACLFDSGDRQRTRNTFVGTPCWMAPEVMEQLHGYDFKADIWSFGITALELAHGHAPFSKYPPMKVLLMTLQNAPPGLDYERDKKFSRSFKQMIAMCLVKDPSKRPSASKLLKQTFFKQARSQDYIARKILEGLPTLGDRYQALKEKEEDMLAQKKMPDGKKEELSQNEYKRGISSWNFDMDDLKAQASLIPENEYIPGKYQEACQNSLFELDTSQERMSEGMPFASDCCLKDDDDDDVESYGTMHNTSVPLPSPDRTTYYHRSRSDETVNNPKLACTNDQNNLQNGIQIHRSEIENCLSESCDSEIDEKQMESVPAHSFHERRASTSSCSRASTTSCSSDILRSSKAESLKPTSQHQNMGNCNGVSQTINDMPIETMPKASKSAASNVDDTDDKSKPPVVQQRGRFKVTSENVGLDKALPPLGLQKSHSMQYPNYMGLTLQTDTRFPRACELFIGGSQPEVFTHFPTSLPSPTDPTSNHLNSPLFQQLHRILQTNILQRDNILNLMKQLSLGELSGSRGVEGISIPSPTILSEKSLMEASNEREKELIQEVTDLQWRVICLQDELQRLKTRTAQVSPNILPSP